MLICVPNEGNSLVAIVKEWLFRVTYELVEHLTF